MVAIILKSVNFGMNYLHEPICWAISSGPARSGANRVDEGKAIEVTDLTGDRFSPKGSLRGPGVRARSIAA